MRKSPGHRGKSGALFLIINRHGRRKCFKDGSEELISKIPFRKLGRPDLLSHLRMPARNRSTGPRQIAGKPDPQQLAAGQLRAPSNPLTRAGLFPVLPDAADAERRAVFHGDGIGLLRPLALYYLPLKETVNWNDAAARLAGVPERRQVAHGLAPGVDRLAAAGWVLCTN